VDDLVLGQVTSCVGDHVVVKMDRGSKPPKIGRKVFTDKKPVGSVFDVIGPADEPYAVVKTLKGVHGKSLVGKKLFLG